MDIVYYVKEGDDNAELRYSLRSLENLPHERVHMIGYKPRWVQNVNHIPVSQGTNKYANTSNYMRIVAESEDVSDDYILMNDDFFIMKPIKELPILHRGSLDTLIKNYKLNTSSYFYGMRDTRDYMKWLGLENLKCYELHIPMAYNKDKVIDMLDQYDHDAPPVEILHKRTLYGNLYNIGGDKIHDVKVYDKYGTFDKYGVFLSTNDEMFKEHKVGMFIKNSLPEKSIYEK